jgi:hypothetical protein
MRHLSSSLPACSCHNHSTVFSQFSSHRLLFWVHRTGKNPPGIYETKTVADLIIRLQQGGPTYEWFSMAVLACTRTQSVA